MAEVAVVAHSRKSFGDGTVQRCIDAAAGTHTAVAILPARTSNADRAAKDRLGPAAYIVSGIKNVAARRVRATVEVDGRAFFKGKVSCVLAANVGKILGHVADRNGDESITRQPQAH